MFNKKLENRIYQLERSVRNDWDVHDQRVRELYERIARLETQREQGIVRHDLRVEVLEGAVTEIARALDDHGIEKPCKTCGQKLLKEKSK